MGKKIKDMTLPEAEEVREGWRTRKQNQRERDADKEAERIRQNTFDSPPQFWESQRKKLPADELAKLNERQERVFDTLHWMESWVSGTYDVSPDDSLCYVGLEEGIADLEADVAHHRLTMIEVTLIPFWKPEESDFFKRAVAKGGPTRTFIQYGIVTGIPEHRYAAFARKFIQKHSTITPYASTLSCLCGQTTSVSIETAKEYATRQYRCQRCLDRDAVSRAAVAKALAVEYQRPENQILDSWGRIKL